MERHLNVVAKPKLRLRRSKNSEFSSRAYNIPALRQYFLFELRLVSAEAIHGGDAAHWSVQILKKFIGDARGNFGSVAPGAHVFVGDDHAVGLRHGTNNGFPIVRRQRSEVQNLERDALVLQFDSGYFGAMHQSAVADNANVATFANDA